MLKLVDLIHEFSDIPVHIRCPSINNTNVKLVDLIHELSDIPVHIRCSWINNTNTEIYVLQA